jgi:DNA-binding transcriptional LysR family regulator
VKGTVGLGEVIAKDVVALPMSEDLRLTVVGSPSYLERHGAPGHPQELTDHVCINWTPSADDAGHRWEFTEDGKDFSVSADARVVTTDPGLPPVFPAPPELAGRATGADRCCAPGSPWVERPSDIGGRPMFYPFVALVVLWPVRSGISKTGE